MENGDRYESVLTRRDFAAIAATTGAAALAGCGETPSAGDDARVDDAGPDDGPELSIQPLDDVVPHREVEFVVSRAGRPVEGATVEVIDGEIDETDAEGRVSLEIPYEPHVSLGVVVPVEDDDASATDGSETEFFDRTFQVFDVPEGNYESTWFETEQTAAPIEEVTYNPHVPEGRSSAMDGLFAPYAPYDRERDEFLPYLFSGWEHESDRMVATLREDVTWTTGEPVDAAAIVFQWEILLATDHPAATVLTDVTATGEYEVSFHYEAGTAPRLVEHAVLHERADHPPADWQPVHDGELGPEELTIDEPTSSGPLALLERGDAELDATGRTVSPNAYVPRGRLAEHDDHPAADHYNWHGYHVRYEESSQGTYNSIISVEIDGVQSLYAGPDAIREFPDWMQEVQVPASRGIALWFNHEDGPFADRAVRRALAHSVDLEAVAAAVGENTKAVPEVQSGLAVTAAEEWLGSATPEEFERYENDEDRARELVAGAGYELGEFDVALLVPVAADDEIRVAGNVADQLGAAGWSVDLTYAGYDNYPTRHAEGEFDLLVASVGGDPHHFHPYFALRDVLLADDGGPPALAGYEPPTDADVAATLDELATTRDTDRQAELVRDLARVVNQDLPFLLAARDVEQHFVDRQAWRLPEESPYLRTRAPFWWLPLAEDVPEDAERVAPPGQLEASRTGH